WLKKLHGRFEAWYSMRFVKPQFERLGPGHHLMKPWNVKLHGKHIAVGKNFHMVTDRDRRVSFSTWTLGDHQGRITLGDNVLVCPGCRFDSASGITVGDNCMFAAGAYLTDADWHDIYDRTQAVGVTRPIVLEDNVWIGDGATVCKGVTIGRNSVIGAGSVVTSNIPANVIAAGNPARVVKPLDPERELVTRAALFNDVAKLDAEMDRIDRYVLVKNNLWGWLRSKLSPRQGD
ncbi:MAG: acyltransferase, partial [Proteobacteria bacterium]|nr:acyltransferase [Pseudomonadota bacterium]